MSLLATILGKSNWESWSAWPLKESKFERILELCAGKEVLDCGCVGSKLETVSDMPTTSHHNIAKASSHCVGVDIVADEVDRRKAAGYDVRLANVETMKLGQTFDVVVAADLIEHLSNAGAFLDRVHEHLRPNGLLCLVTPNPLSANVVFKSLVGIRSRVNPEHTCWYDPQTLQQLLWRHGFRPVEWYWQDYQRHPLAVLATGIRPNLAAHFIVISKRSEAGTP